MKVNVSDSPLEIRYISTGSLLIKLFGLKVVIKLLTKTFKNVTTWAYRNYTTDGKMEKVPKKIERLEKILGLRGQLKEQGIDTTDMDESINKAGTVIAQEFNELLGKSFGITINQTSYGSHQTSQRLLAEQKLLEEGQKKVES